MDFSQFTALILKPAMAMIFLGIGVTVSFFRLVGRSHFCTPECNFRRRKDRLICQRNDTLFPNVLLLLPTSMQCGSKKCEIAADDARRPARPLPLLLSLSLSLSLSFSVSHAAAKAAVPFVQTARLLPTTTSASYSGRRTRTLHVIIIQ
jgi:hypothetical protein